MRVLLLIALVACQGGGEQYPVDPGGPGGMTMMQDGSLIDAPDPDGLALLAGRVCLVTDLRGLDYANSGAQDITVTLGANTALTGPTGAFSIVTPSASNPVWRARGANLVSSVMPFGPSKTIPIISVQTYLDLQNANSVTIAGDMGSIVARLVRNNAALADATATVEPPAAFAIKYDGSAPLAWTELKTSAAGMAWIPGAGLGSNTVTIAPMTGNPKLENVLVEDQAITYVTIEVP